MRLIIVVNFFSNYKHVYGKLILLYFFNKSNCNVSTNNLDCHVINFYFN